jgi:hypothetical protein
MDKNSYISVVFVILVWDKKTDHIHVTASYIYEKNTRYERFNYNEAKYNNDVDLLNLVIAEMEERGYKDPRKGVRNRFSDFVVRVTGDEIEKFL